MAESKKFEWPYGDYDTSQGFISLYCMTQYTTRYPHYPCHVDGCLCWCHKEPEENPEGCA